MTSVVFVKIKRTVLRSEKKHNESKLSTTSKFSLKKNKKEYMHTAHTVVKAYMVRMCIGRKVAELEMFTLLAAIITRFQVDIIIVIKVFRWSIEMSLEISFESSVSSTTTTPTAKNNNKSLPGWLEWW